MSFGPEAPGPDSLVGAFQEVAGLGATLQAPADSPVKITGAHKVNDVTLKRGVIGDSQTLASWINNVRSGSGSQKRTVTIQLVDEAGQPVEQWVLTDAWPVKYTGPQLTGKGSDVAIEELVLAAEKIHLK